MEHFTQNAPEDISRRFLRDYSVTPLTYGYQIKEDRISRIRNRINGNFELIHVYRGRIRITLDGRDILCQKGDTLLIAPYTIHTFGPYRDIPYVNTFVHFDVEPYYRLDDFSRLFLKGESAVHLPRTGQWDPLYQRFSRDGSYLEGKYALNACLLALLQAAGGTPSWDSAGVEGKLDEAMGYIKEHMNRDISLPELSRFLGMSLSGLHKLFMRAFGDSPASVIRTMKMRRAEQLLKTTDLPIKEISHMTGFASGLYFSKVFKRYYAKPPREYRETEGGFGS